MNPLVPDEHPSQTSAVGTRLIRESAPEDAALQQARDALGRSETRPETPAVPAAPAESPSVMDALNSENTAARVPARMATLEVLSALDKGVARKQKTAEVQASVEDIMQRLTTEIAQAHRRKWMRRLKIAGFLALIALMLWMERWHMNWQWWYFWWIGGGAWAADQTWGKRHKTVMELRQAGDARAVGALAIAARDAEKAVRQAAEQTLKELLPNVQASHAPYVTPEQMTALLELAFRSEPDMQMAVLKGLEQIGDGRAIPVVENLSLSPNTSVREQAKHCLPFLHLRARQAEQSATLLRGTLSPAQTAAPHELLRSVGHTVQETEGGELLRSASESGENDPSLQIKGI